MDETVPTWKGDQNPRQSDPMNETADAIDEEHSRGHHDVHENAESAAHIRLDGLGHIEGGDEGEGTAGQSYKYGKRNKDVKQCKFPSKRLREFHLLAPCCCQRVFHSTSWR